MDYPTPELPNSEAYFIARNTLPEDLWPVFEDLVRWYRYFATFHYSHPFVSYKILADLVREGWRIAAKPLPD